MEPAELSSLKSILNIARILALVFLIIFILVAIGEILVLVALASIGLAGFALFGAIFPLLAFVISLLIWMQVSEIKRMVDAGQYQAAKDKTLIWMILGFIFGFILGIILLIAYLKFDPVINWQRQMQMGGGQPPAQPPAWGAPPPAAPPMAASAPPPSPPPMPVAAPAAPAAGICPRCGKPATWVAQYNRWYCYNDQQYV
ncbi:MAG: hypothetical protein L3K17_09030 [Thermoplasmata archaeon]|nr:hypothetical protein [Thermoplasmata archaeon]